MDRDRFQFYPLYLARFASGFGFITLVSLLPTYVNLFEASDFMVGLFTTAFTLAQTMAVRFHVPRHPRERPRRSRAHAVVIVSHPIP